MIDGQKVKAGDRISYVFNVRTKRQGVVDYATKEGGYVRVVWTAVRRADVLSRESPLWALLELGT